MAKGLYAKLIAVMEKCGHVEKKGENKHHKYKYVKEEDLYTELRKHLVAEKVLVLPSVRGYQVHDDLIIVDMEYTFIDADSNEKHSCGWAGAGADQGDKGLYKAFTGSMKYFLMKSFQISTGDDPEGDDRVDERTARGVSRPAQSSNRQTAKPAAQRASNPNHLPECENCASNDAVIVDKYKGEGHFYCYKEKGGCGMKFQPREKWIESSDKPVLCTPKQFDDMWAEALAVGMEKRDVLKKAVELFPNQDALKMNEWLTVRQRDDLMRWIGSHAPSDDEAFMPTGGY